jgi:hypothetical protein
MHCNDSRLAVLEKASLRQTQQRQRGQTASQNPAFNPRDLHYRSILANVELRTMILMYL